MRALITGIDGFAGRYLDGHLRERGYEVFGISPPGGTERGGVFYGDIRDRGFMERAVAGSSPDMVFHLAAISFVAHGNPEEVYEVNVLGTLNLYEALKKLEREAKVLFVSSSTVYGVVPRELQPIHEALPVRPVNHYAVSKMTGELMSGVYGGDMIRTVIARPFNHTGVGQHGNFVVPKIVRAFAKRDPSLKLGNIDTYRDFSDVRDVVRAYADMLEGGNGGEIYNVCSGAVFSVRDVIRMLREVSGHEIVIEQDPSLLRKSDVPYVGGDNAKIADEVGWRPLIDFNDTIRWMYNDGVGN